ncbi:helix-hairpin-helix domain-containing protein [Thiomicrorhabdus xiamenensis]|uniref:Mitomycin resistance protein n=1 Tax=Thiomicrorhabdus xiamenensis TaxID=2739063 RepID=A0A7D4NL97_9GAMM|nr:helix-hairpin-helix domain-containing protein [Thiomicrorhabdus xiamenensis]QKI89969.1 mitomycin resistance protein [Thiomicrorhabdus xiamenensis]
MHLTEIKNFRDIPNVGAAIEGKFMTLGLKSPQELIHKDPYQLYEDLCEIMQTRLDPCLLDVFISAVRYMQGEPAQKWWHYTPERKQRMSSKK